jgi:hypothetical protein
LTLPASDRSAQAWGQGLNERNRHQLPTGLVGYDDGIVKRNIVPAFDSFCQNVSDAFKGIRPSRVEIGKLNPISVLDKLVALPKMAVIPRHAP